LKWTCASTTPGSASRPAASISSSAEPRTRFDQRAYPTVADEDVRAYAPSEITTAPRIARSTRATRARW
jgi:hypothetical protein